MEKKTKKITRKVETGRAIKMKPKYKIGEEITLTGTVYGSKYGNFPKEVLFEKFIVTHIDTNAKYPYGISKINNGIAEYWIEE